MISSTCHALSRHFHPQQRPAHDAPSATRYPRRAGRPRRSGLAAGLAICLALAAPGTTSAGDCVKRVFSRYCLGGPLATLPDEQAQRGESDADGLTRYRYTDDGKPVEVGAREGRIVSVIRRERPGSYLNFTDWKVKLVRLYGRAEDLSSFPHYAASRSARLNAINAGRGFALVSWPQDGWTVSLRWNNPEHVQLEYRLEVRVDAPSTEEEGL